MQGSSVARFTPSPEAPGTSPSTDSASAVLESGQQNAAPVSFPLSWEQEQIWLHEKLSPGLPLYSETFVLAFRGELDPAALESSLYELCKRHAIWRTTIRETATDEHNGTPCQIVGLATPIKVEIFDLSAHPDALRVQQLERLLNEFARRPFDLARGPLLRVFAARFGREDTRIFLTLHHLIFDGVSLRQIILPELIELYNAYRTGRASALTSPKLQYAEYASQQRAENHAPREAAMAFWRSRLANLSPLNLPSDRPLSANITRRGAVHTFCFDEGLAQAVADLSRRERTTAFSVLLASFIVLLARSSDTLDVTIGTSYGGRTTTELESVVGCFLNTVLLRTDLSGDPSFRDLLQRVRGVTLDGLEHADAPFQEVVRESLPRTSLGDAPVRAVFAFQPPSPALPPDWDLDVFGVFNGCAKFDLHLEVEQKPGALRGRLMYSTDLFDAATIESLYAHWINLIRAASQEPETCIWKLPLLGAAEQRWLLYTLNESATETPELCMHDLFTARAEKSPERVALTCQGRSLTYMQLDEWSARIALHLRDLGFGDGAVIGLMVERSTEMLAGLLGILRAGAAYVPLDPTYPAARLAHMMQASGMSLLLTQASLINRLPDAHPPLLDVADCLAHQVSDASSREPLPNVPLSASAYIIFTSGSTGVPKGVEIPHSALTNLLWSMRETPGIVAGDVLLAITSICFDIAALELYLPLIAGARIELATAEQAADPQELSRLLAQSGATILQATPSSWRMLLESGWDRAHVGSPPLKILCGGEALAKPLARQLLERSNSVWNMYGPTETTVWSACDRVQIDRIRSETAQIALGDPVANTSLFVLDTHQALVPAGISGELYIGGAGLACGYCGQPELTRERFPSVVLGDGPVRRLYRTGDRVKRLRDGSLVFLGRMDRQVKLHGFRIELGEIEQALNEQAGVQESIVVQTQHSTRGEILAGFVVARPGFTLQVDELRAGLAKLLPQPMQPSVLHVLQEVPLTLNGKLDRSRLLDLAPSEESPDHEKPRSAIEEKLAGIWCDLLSLKSVGRRENFFDLGGHSLLAVRFVSLTNRALARELTLASFIQAPTIAQFAEIVQGRSAPRTVLLKRASVPGQQTAGKQLLWIGAEPWLARFARHLNDDLTLYTITPDVESLARQGTACTIEALAAQILGHVRELQPEGPYVLGGFCLRGLLAYEIAQRLQQEGQEIALLILGELYVPGRKPAWTLAERVLRRLYREFFNLVGTFRSPATQWALKLRDLFDSWIHRKPHWSLAPETPFDLLYTLHQASLRHQLTPYSGRVLFLESQEGRLFRGSTSGTWNGLIDDMQIFGYSGIHEDFFNEPILGEAAATIQHAIERALCSELSCPEILS